MPSTRNEIRTGGYIASLEKDRKQLRAVRLLILDVVDALVAFEAAANPEAEKRAVMDFVLSAKKLRAWQETLSGRIEPQAKSGDAG